MPDDSRYDPGTALVVVDVQNDFAHPEGSLYVDEGHRIIDGINAEIEAARHCGATVVLTQDWHPDVTPHFVDHGGTWPTHCVRNTWGAELHPDLSREADLLIRKGTGGEDGYSAFTLVDPESGETKPTGLGGYLRDRGITEVVIAGLAADVCVRATALDAVESGFRPTVLWELTRAVELDEGDTARTLDELLGARVEVVGGDE